MTQVTTTQTVLIPQLASADSMMSCYLLRVVNNLDYDNFTKTHEQVSSVVVVIYSTSLSEQIFILLLH
jgi:hypothetical protein